MTSEVNPTFTLALNRLLSALILVSKVIIPDAEKTQRQSRTLSLPPVQSQSRRETRETKQKEMEIFLPGTGKGGIYQESTLQ